MAICFFFFFFLNRERQNQYLKITNAQNFIFFLCSVRNCKFQPRYCSILIAYGYSLQQFITVFGNPDWELTKVALATQIILGLLHGQESQDHGDVLLLDPLICSPYFSSFLLHEHHHQYLNFHSNPDSTPPIITWQIFCNYGLNVGIFFFF